MSLGGPIAFNAKGQVEGNRSAVIQNLDGKPTMTLPADFAEGKLVFPSPDYKKA
jgi:branched-chain amino acid transport system substrate-binding protein